MEFPNAKFRPGHDNRLFYDIFNAKDYKYNGFDGSVHDYYYDQSYGQLDLTFDIVGPFMMPEPYEYYGMDRGNNTHYTHQMVETAIKMADDVVDFSQYVWEGMDRVSPINIIYAGFSESMTGNADNIWSACTTVNDYYDGVCLNRVPYSSELRHLGEQERLCGIGTICHELAHGFGLPDIYDQTTGNYGTQNWDLMDIGCHGNYGITPSGMTAFDKYSLGWVEPVLLYDDTSVYDMLPMSQQGDCYKIQNPCCENEFYLLEYRDQNKWDKYLAAHGMLITHVDYDKDLFDRNIVNRTGPEFDNDHERCGLILADNDATKTEQGYIGDLWPYKGNNALTATSVPAAILYNQNADLSYLMHKDITDIQEVNGRMSFTFTNHIDKLYYGVTGYGDHVRFTSESSFDYLITVHNTQKRTFGKSLKFTLYKYADGNYYEMQTVIEEADIEALGHQECTVKFANTSFDDPDAEYYVHAYYQSRDDDDSWRLMTETRVNTDELNSCTPTPSEKYQYIVRDNNTATIITDITNNSFRDYDTEIWLFTFFKQDGSFVSQPPKSNIYHHLGAYESMKYIFSLSDLLPDQTYHCVLFRYNSDDAKWEQMCAPFKLNTDSNSIAASRTLDANINRLSVRDSQMQITSEHDFAQTLLLHNDKDCEYSQDIKFILCENIDTKFREIKSVTVEAGIAAGDTKLVSGTSSNELITNPNAKYYIFSYFKAFDGTEYWQQLDKSEVSTNMLGGNRLTSTFDYSWITREDNSASITIAITNHSYIDFDGRAITMFTKLPDIPGWQKPQSSVSKRIAPFGTENFTFELTGLERYKEYTGHLYYHPTPDAGWAIVEPGISYSIIVTDENIVVSISSPIADLTDDGYRVYSLNGAYTTTIKDRRDISHLPSGLYIIVGADGIADKLFVQ